MTGLAGPSSFILALSLFWHSTSARSNTRCLTGALDWYTDVLGETPCDTYQRLRQICNGDYKVQPFKRTTPGDICDEQVTACCCNTVAFQLSMLCMNCQYTPVDGEINGVTGNGFDAPSGTYSQYLHGCSGATTDSLPEDIQTAVCNVGIQLDEFLFNSWNDGAWFYGWTKENAEGEHNANNNQTLNRCSSNSPANAYSYSIAANTGTFNVAPTSSLSSSSPTSTDNGSRNTNQNAAATNAIPSAGTIAGIVVGLILLLLIGGLAVWLMRRRNQRPQQSLQSFREKFVGGTTPRPHARPAPGDSPTRAAFLPRPRSPAPADTLPRPFALQPSAAPRRRELVFTPEAMVRPASDAPVERVTTRRRMSMVSRDDSRVADPFDESPDPDMPMEPLRLEVKEKVGLH